MRSYVLSGLIAFSISAGVIWIAPEVLERKTLKIEHVESAPGALYTMSSENEIVPLDFTKVAGEVMDAVVHIKSTTTYNIPGNPDRYSPLPDPFRDFFGDEFYDQFFGPGQRGLSPGQPRARVGSGSGVIINSEGYIITNHHVVASAEDIEVTLYDRRTYRATLVGTDPSTDLALIRIKEKNLPTIPLVDSDNVKIGEWVLAIGNPFNLYSTVTAGIVSAKSRNINILRDKYAIESFIQTDAAINPGNSGGALVNLQGALIGVNTAIASPTGAYAGYGFAVPSNIVNKVVEDLIKYGSVQRGYLGVTIRNVNGNLAREKGLDIMRGVYVDSVAENSSAHDAGLKAGDVILEVNDSEINSASELQEIIARQRPGDKVKITVHRQGKEKIFSAKLKNLEGDTRFVAKSNSALLNTLGAEFEEIDPSTAKELGIDGGIKVNKLYAGKFSRYTDMKEGFIITKVDGVPVQTVDELTEILENKEGGVLIEGVYEDIPGTHYYAFGL